MKKKLPIFSLLFTLLTFQQTLLGEENDSSWSIYKKVKYEFSLEYTKATSLEWWNKIEPYNIYLGALPLKNKGHLQEIADLGVTKILSLAENFELETGWFNQPVKAEEFLEIGIKVEHIPAIDFFPLTKSQIDRSIDILSRALLENHKVYVHCKAGRGRSATVIIAYLMTQEDLTFEEAYAFVKEIRPEIHLNSKQQQAIIDYFEIIPFKNEKDLSLGSLANTLSESLLSKIMNQNFVDEETQKYALELFLYHVINGGLPGLDEQTSQTLGKWIPALKSKPILHIRNLLLCEFQGDQEAAACAAFERSHCLFRKLKVKLLPFLPIVGTPMGHGISLWYQLREIALIASIHGHDLQDPAVQAKVLSALIGGDLLKLPATSVDAAAKIMFVKFLANVGLQGVSSSYIPVFAIFNFFTDDSAKVSSHAKLLFGGENSLPTLPEEYL